MIHKALLSILITLLLSSTLYGQSETSGVADIRIYHLKSGSRGEFQQLVEKTIPLVEEWGMAGLAHGLSQVNENEYYLVRGFENYQSMYQKEQAFYSSDAWRNGPREEVLSHIKSYSVLRVPIDSLQNYSIKTMTMKDLDQVILSKLNAQFIDNFLNEDVEAHQKIIARDFVCIYGNGTTVKRQKYMENWANAYSNSGYTSFSITDEVIRIFDDMALVRSKTIYTKEVDGEIVYGNSLYTDTYIKEDGEWLCVQAQITPITVK